MGWDGWVQFDGTELFNVYRVAANSEALGIDTVWIDSVDFSWINDHFMNADLLSLSPWYDSGIPASTEFAGVLPLSVQGLDDSTLSSSVTEYTDDGGAQGKSRNATAPLVVSAALVASSERGAEFGRRWLNKVLRGGASIGTSMFCAGFDLDYFRYQGSSTDLPPIVHRRDVRCTRGVSVTRKRVDDCSSIWMITFTLTAADPYEYGAEIPLFQYMDFLDKSVALSSPAILDTNTTVQINTLCPVYDYSPIYDPRFPALVPAPSAPNMTPDGWTIADGDTFERVWCTVAEVEPSELDYVPLLKITTPVETRMVRIGIWKPGASHVQQCGELLFGCVVSYVPVGTTFYIDGEQKAAYVWDGASPQVRRADSLVYSHDGGPVQWTSFPFEQGTLVTMDLFGDSDGFEGSDTTKLFASIIPKSD